MGNTHKGFRIFVKNLIFVPTRLIIITIRSKSIPLEYFQSLEFVQSFLPVSLFGKTVKYFYFKIVPSMFPDGIIEMSLFTIVGF